MTAVGHKNWGINTNVFASAITDGMVIKLPEKENGEDGEKDA